MTEQIRNVLPRGKEHRITARQIAAMFEIHDSQVRDVINQLRCGGVPVCSDRRGYYLSDDPVDIRAQIMSIEHRMNAMFDAIQGLKTALPGGDQHQSILSLG